MLIVAHAVIPNSARSQLASSSTQIKKLNKNREERRRWLSDACGDNGVKGLNPNSGHEPEHVLYPEPRCPHLRCDEADHESK
jgi:siroheme synthase (precorrin-2 oxidase/ferrochelatase)